MRLGIRLQLLLALGSLLVLAFVPLFFAVANLTRATMTSIRASTAVTVGRAIGGQVACRGASNNGDLAALLDSQIGSSGVAAIGVYDSLGQLVARAGERGSVEALPRFVRGDVEQTAVVRARHGTALLVIPKAPREARSAVAVLVRTDPETTSVAPLVRLVALYTGVVGLALLVFAYFSMTRLVVEPIDQLSTAARRVAEGVRHLDSPQRGARELVDLGMNLARMTERLRADDEALHARIAEIARYADDLSRTQERLMRSERLASVGRLAAGLAHEIGNPISAILGFQELLLQGGLDEREQRDFLERMKRETERIHHVLRDLLDFARPVAASSGAASMVTEPPGDVREAISDAVALVEPQKPFRGVAIHVDVAPDLPRVTLSHSRLVQVLLNLLLNAGSAVPRDDGRIVVRATRQSVAERLAVGVSAKDRVRIEVEDNGSGIPPEIRDRLFEPFATTKGVGEGTGLGLAVCRGLVEAASGTIAAEAGDGGARFVIELPGQD